MAKKPSKNSDAELIAREAVREHLRKAGRKGGETMKKRGRAYYQEIGRKGAAARWENNKTKKCKKKTKSK